MMNPFKNTLLKVKALLKEDNHLKKDDLPLYQWQLLIKIPGDYTFYVGKGGVNTIFYSASSAERAVCYPEEILEILERLSKSEVFCYHVIDAKKNVLGYAFDLDSAKKLKGANAIASVSFKGKKKLASKKITDLFGKKIWQDK